MPDLQRLKRRVVHTAQRLVVKPRRTAIGGRVIGNEFWMVSEHGEHSRYVLNIKANPAVRLRLHGRWRPGTAHLLPDDDAHEGLRACPVSTARWCG
jgi:deazaflavin-dependent oxidoreductase (nitroreductase family)